MAGCRCCAEGKNCGLHLRPAPAWLQRTRVKSDWRPSCGECFTEGVFVRRIDEAETGSHQEDEKGSENGTRWSAS